MKKNRFVTVFLHRNSDSKACRWEQFSLVTLSVTVATTAWQPERQRVAESMLMQKRT